MSMQKKVKKTKTKTKQNKQNRTKQNQKNLCGLSNVLTIFKGQYFNLSDIYQRWKIYMFTYSKFSHIYGGVTFWKMGCNIQNKT